MRILRFLQSITLLALFVAFVEFIFPINLHSQEMIEINVIHLKDDSTIRGIIEEQIPDISYKIAITNENIFLFSHSDVEKITTEKVESLKERSPVGAFIASFWIPGLGQMVVNKDYLKGIGFFVGTVGGIYIAATCGVNPPPGKMFNETQLVTGLLLWLCSHWGAAIEAAITAKSYNKKLRAAQASQGIGTVSLSPTVNQFNLVDKQVLSYGVSLKLNF